MSDVWFSSDWHLNHKNILQYCKRPWLTVEEMQEGLISLHNSRVKPGDRVYFLGDMIFGKEKLLPEMMQNVFSRLNGQKFLIKGNHDYYWKEEWFTKHFQWVRDYCEVRVEDKDAPNGKWRNFVLCHYPLYSWNHMGHGSICLSGHTHGSIDKINLETRRMDVGVDAMYSNYAPINATTILEIMKDRKLTIVDHHDGTNL